ncbi:MAG: glycosyltransferase family 2 protein [Desulfofustis sp.]|nr:glycosyltransferase family 2 protein [Desulfofustis sp.]
MQTRPANFVLSIIIPVYNEADNIHTLYNEISNNIKTITNKELIFINDGSSDHTLEQIQALQQVDPSVHFINFSRNFGHQCALKAGLELCSGDVVISIDGDLQHPPSLLPLLLDKWKDGYDVVITIREELPGGNFFKRFTSHNFYRLLAKISDLRLKPGSADFRLLDRKVVDVLKRFEEIDIFYRGFVAWSGFKQYEISYVPEKRKSGATKYTTAKMIRLALNGLLGFSTLPLRLVTLTGLVISLVSFTYGFYAICIKIFSDSAISGWASIMTGIYFLGGVQLLCIGICGEYIGRIFMQVKKRPHYIIAETSLKQDP